MAHLLGTSAFSQTDLPYRLWCRIHCCNFQGGVLFVGDASALPARESHQQKTLAHKLGKHQGYFILVLS